MSRKSEMKKSALQRLSQTMRSIITNADIKRKRFSPGSKQIMTKRIKLKPEPTSLFSRFTREGDIDVETNYNHNNNTFNLNNASNNESDKKLKTISKIWIPPLKTNNVQQVDKLNNINSENMNVFKAKKSKQEINKWAHLSKTTSTTVNSENNNEIDDSFVLTNSNVEQIQESEENYICKSNNTNLEDSSDYLRKEVMTGSSGIDASVATLQDAETVIIDADNDNCTGQLKSKNNYLNQTMTENENEKETHQFPRNEFEYFINSDDSEPEVLDINFKETKIEFDKTSNQNDLLIISKDNDDVNISSCIKIIAEVDESAKKVENINDKVDENLLINEKNNNIHKSENIAGGSLIDEKNLRTDSEIITIKDNVFEEMQSSQKLKSVPSDYDISNKNENNHNIVYIDLINDENITTDFKINSPEIDFEEQISENIEEELNDTVLISNEAEDDGSMNEGSIPKINFTLNSQDMAFKGDDKDSIQNKILTSNDSNRKNSLKEIIKNSQIGSITDNETLHDIKNYDCETEVLEKYSDVINNEHRSIPTIHGCEKDMMDHDKINDDTEISVKNNKKEKYNVNKPNKENTNDLLNSLHILTDDNKNIVEIDKINENFSENLDVNAISDNTQVKENNLEISDERNLESSNDPDVISIHSSNQQSQENLSGFKDNSVEMQRELDESNSSQKIVTKQENYDEYIKCNDDFYSIPMSEVIRIENEYQQTETNNEPKDHFSNENNNIPITKINNLLQNNSTDQTLHQNLPCVKDVDFPTPVPTIHPPKLDWIQRVNQEKQKIRSIIQEINKLNLKSIMKRNQHNDKYCYC
ncbi:uncharacterized protein LOC142319064 isoform X2 [Lycorma delicatula]|uniref:uncharacterized protein LOC142319064 isoform X2 n=1 Tax=Lycorma delicatula TaxID=130591 RepID=UPI003F519F03